MRPANDTPKTSARPKSARRTPNSSYSDDANVASTLPPRATYRADGVALRVGERRGVRQDQQLEPVEALAARYASCTSSNGTRASTSAWYMPST